MKLFSSLLTGAAVLGTVGLGYLVIGGLPMSVPTNNGPKIEVGFNTTSNPVCREHRLSDGQGNWHSHQECSGYSIQQTLVITNIGDEEIQINNVMFNGQEECQVKENDIQFLGLSILNPKNATPGKKLQTGGTVELINPCDIGARGMGVNGSKIIKVQIETNLGTVMFGK